MSVIVRGVISRFIFMTPKVLASWKTVSMNGADGERTEN